ncbi:MAG: oligosaccharide flippase family protein [Candidatus Moranbacteria bacterium]|nr:oligosaccharide flippase family protein [Candidatus Moranbacteria bacterium]
MISSASVKQKFFRLAEIIHLRLFGHGMGEEMRKFLGNLSWSFFGGVIAAGIMFAVNILAGRWLGPEEYGKYNLVFLMAQVFFIPMLLGMDVSAARAVSIADANKEKISRIISGSVFVVLGSIAVTVPLLFFGSDHIAEFFSATSDMVLIAIFFAVAIALKALFDGAVRGLHFFRFQAMTRMFEGIVGMIIFLAAFFFLRDHLSLAFSVVISALLVSSIYVLKMWVFFSGFSIASIRELLRYAKFVVIGSVITLILGYGDRYVVNRYLGIEELGIYSAYYTATILVVGQFIAIFANVFFPMIAKVGEKREIMKKLDRLVLIGIIPAVAGIFVIGFLILKLFGSAYAVDPLTLLLFGVVAALQFFVSFYSGMVNAHNERTYFWGLTFFAMRAIVYAAYIVALIATNSVTVSAILAGLIVNYVVDMLNLRYIIRKYA